MNTDLEWQVLALALLIELGIAAHAQCGAYHPIQGRERCCRRVVGLRGDDLCQITTACGSC
jgi:hypothetical protein